MPPVKQGNWVGCEPQAGRGWEVAERGSQQKTKIKHRHLRVVSKTFYHRTPDMGTKNMKLDYMIGIYLDLEKAESHLQGYTVAILASHSRHEDTTLGIIVPTKRKGKKNVNQFQVRTKM